MFIETETGALAVDTAHLFVRHYVKCHGLPMTISSDRDSNFTSKIWTSVTSIQKTQHNLSSVFRPQTDGQTERTNRFIEDYLRGVVNPSQTDWNEYLHFSEFTYSRRVHSSIGMSPFEADLDHVPYMPDDSAADPQFNKIIKRAQECVLQQEVFLKKAQDAKAQERMRSYYYKNRIQQTFEVGDLVLLDGKNLDIGHRGFSKTNKLAPRLIGPYCIIEKVHKDSYRITMSKNLRIHPVFHTSLLKL